MLIVALLGACTPSPDADAPAGPSAACSAAIDAYDARMEAIVAVVAESQTWDIDQAQGPIIPVPKVDRPLVKRVRRPRFRVERRADGTLHVDDGEVELARPALDRTLRDALVKSKEVEAQIGPRGPVVLEAVPDTPVEELQMLLDALHAAGVETLDLVVERVTHPALPEVAPPPGEEGRIASLRTDPTSMPSLKERIAACPLDPSLSTAKSELEAVTTERVFARQALAACDCAVAPDMFLWAAWLRYVPKRLTNVIPVTLPARLEGTTWADAAQNPVVPVVHAAPPPRVPMTTEERIRSDREKLIQILAE